MSSFSAPQGRSLAWPGTWGSIAARVYAASLSLSLSGYAHTCRAVSLPRGRHSRRAVGAPYAAHTLAARRGSTRLSRESRGTDERSSRGDRARDRAASLQAYLAKLLPGNSRPSSTRWRRAGILASSGHGPGRSAARLPPELDCDGGSGWWFPRKGAGGTRLLRARLLASLPLAIALARARIYSWRLGCWAGPRRAHSSLQFLAATRR